ncbi:hypothetical protein T08_14496 [Trichinella sp. T8]|nr:hypothetical protein T08_14496 [Trichinella sp. T8]
MDGLRRRTEGSRPSSEPVLPVNFRYLRPVQLLPLVASPASADPSLLSALGEGARWQFYRLDYFSLNVVLEGWKESLSELSLTARDSLSTPRKYAV